MTEDARAEAIRLAREAGFRWLQDDDGTHIFAGTTINTMIRLIALARQPPATYGRFTGEDDN